MIIWSAVSANLMSGKRKDFIERLFLPDSPVSAPELATGTSGAPLDAANVRRLTGLDE